MKRSWTLLARLGWIALALVALVNGGCLLAVAGVGAGAAAGYAYYNGLLYRDYHAGLADTLAAVKTSLAELQFPIIEQKAEAGGAYVKTRTADGHTVRIHLDVVNSPIPIEGSLTRVGVRVGFSGDEAISARILDTVSSHLVPPGAVPAPAPTATPGGATLGVPQAKVQPTALRPVSFETTAPPLAPPVPVAPSRTAGAPPRR